MKVAFDTNAIIDLCENDEWTNRVVEHAEVASGIEVVIVAEVNKQLDMTKRTPAERTNFGRLEAVSGQDEQRYFTIGVSILDGGDVLRGDSALVHGIQRELYDLGGAYRRYSEEQVAAAQPVATIEKWLDHNNHQADAVIYERASELGCDYLVTSDKRINRVVPAGSVCKPITLADFLSLVR